MPDFLSTLLPTATVPDTLFHYTDQNGLLGIVGEGIIWATHTQYLNDSREFVHALDLVRQEIETQRKSATGERGKVLSEMAEAATGDLQTINVCVCSFSAARDSLPQWRAYGGQSAGFAIGFAGDYLKKTARDHGMVLAPCIYDAQQQKNIVELFVSGVADEIIEQKARKRTAAEVLDMDDFWDTGGNVRAYINQIAPFFKDRSFQEEQEWRIISQPLACSHEQFRFRPGRSTLIPYYRIALEHTKDTKANERIREIMIGPTPSARLSTMAVQSLLVKNEFLKGSLFFGSTQVTVSSTPFRSW